MIAERLATMAQGARTDLYPIGQRSIEQAAALMSVGHGTVQRARAVRTKGAPEVVATVERSALAVSTAALAARRRRPAC